MRVIRDAGPSISQALLFHHHPRRNICRWISVCCRFYTYNIGKPTFVFLCSAHRKSLGERVLSCELVCPIYITRPMRQYIYGRREYILSFRSPAFTPFFHGMFRLRSSLAHAGTSNVCKHVCRYKCTHTYACLSICLCICV